MIATVVDTKIRESKIDENRYFLVLSILDDYETKKFLFLAFTKLNDAEIFYQTGVHIIEEYDVKKLKNKIISVDEELIDFKDRRFYNLRLRYYNISFFNSEDMRRLDD